MEGEDEVEVLRAVRARADADNEVVVGVRLQRRNEKKKGSVVREDCGI